jgi:hypothetical protein
MSVKEAIGENGESTNVPKTGQAEARTGDREKGFDGKWQKKYYGAIWRCTTGYAEMVMHLRVDEIEEMLEFAKHQVEQKAKLFIRSLPAQKGGRGYSHSAYVLVEKGSFGWQEKGYEGYRKRPHEAEENQIKLKGGEEVFLSDTKATK